MMRGLVNLRPVSSIGRAEQSAAPRGADEDSIAPRRRQRPIMVVLTGPVFAVGRKESCALADGDEPIAGAEDRVEVFPFLAALGA